MARNFLSKVLESTGTFSLLLKLRRAAATSQFLTVLTYHRIGDPEQSRGLDDEVVDARPQAFERQLDFLKEHCSVIGLDNLLELKGGRQLPPNAVLLTFDDGYRDNHDTALPILQRHGMKAVFFIATSYLDERRLFWWDRVNLLLKRSTKEVLELEYPRRLSVPLGPTAADRARAVRRTLAVIESHYGLDLPRYLSDVERASGVTFGAEDERRAVDEILMTWDQVRALKRAGMFVESHTRTHRVLHTLSRDDLRDELAGSRARLEEVVGGKVSAVAYPVGKGLGTASDARAAIRAAGYELGFSNGTGINHVWKFDPLNVRRLGLELDISDAYFHGMVALPYFAYEPHAPGRVSLLP